MVIGKKAASQIVVKLICTTFCGSPPALVGWIAWSAATPEQPRRDAWEGSGAVSAVLKGCSKLIFTFLVGFGEGRLAAVTNLMEDSQSFASMNVRNSRKPRMNSPRTEKGPEKRIKKLVAHEM